MTRMRKLMAMAAMTCAAVAALLGLSAGTANADTVNWDAVAQCESGGNWSTSTGNGFYGGLQFKPSTWAAHGGQGSPAAASREQQIQVAERVLATQGLKAWPTCGQKASNAVWATNTAPRRSTVTPVQFLFSTVNQIVGAFVPAGSVR